MPNAANLTFLSSAVGQRTSEVFDNDKYSLAVLQVTGVFTGAWIVVEGRADRNGPWETLGGINVSDTTEADVITNVGIYEYGIDGIAQIRVRLAALGGGSVTVTGVLYDAADRSLYPGGMSAIRFGDPALFVKGVAEQVYMDPLSGNIVGYDRVPASAAVTMSVNLTEIAGGMGNRLLGVIPDTTRISGTYSSEAFSLRTRRLITGGALGYDAVCPFCERIYADSDTLTVTGTPVRSYAQEADDDTFLCYVREIGSGTQRGAAYRIDPTSGEIMNFFAEAGKTYEVTYYVHRMSALGMTVPNVWNPVVMTVQTRYGVYGRQGKRERQGVLRGWLYFIVPCAILSADAGMDASQTENGSTGGSWTALSVKREAMPYCACAENVSPIAYYVYVPCGDEVQSVDALVVLGGGMSVAAGRSARLPVKFLFADGTIGQPDFSLLNYLSRDDSIAEADADGFVHGISEGSTTVAAYLSRENGETLAAYCPVTVTGTRSAVAANPGNVTIL